MQLNPVSLRERIPLDHSSSVPLHRQIYQWVRRAILDGQLQPKWDDGGSLHSQTRSLCSCGIEGSLKCFPPRPLPVWHSHAEQERPGLSDAASIF